ncbi:45209_t:CDS:2, partial [Gigaspora margarita]
KDTNRLKNSLFYHDKLGQYEQRNGIEIEKQALQPRRLIQKENFSRNQPINEQTHLKRPFQGSNNIRIAEKDKNTRNFSQYNHHKRVWKPKEDKAQLVEKADIINSKIITESDYGAPLINLDLKTLRNYSKSNQPSWKELDNTMDNLNRMWDSFEEGILFAAK